MPKEAVETLWETRKNVRENWEKHVGIAAYEDFLET